MKEAVAVEAGKFGGQVIEFLVEPDLTRTLIMFAMIERMGVYYDAMKMERLKDRRVKECLYRPAIGIDFAL